MRSKWVLAMAMAAAVALPGVSFAAKAADKPAPMTGLYGVNVSGSIAGGFLYDSNRPAPAAGLGSQVSGRAFDVKDYQFSLQLAKLVLQKDATVGKPGFNIALAFGSTADLVAAAEPAGAEVYKHVEQAYVEMKKVLLGREVTVDFGKFVTQHGAEVIEIQDNWNLSQGFLFTSAIPFYHAGVRATTDLMAGVTGQLNITNGWNNVVDNNLGKTIGVQLVGNNMPVWWTVNWMGGPEAPNNSGMRSLIDVVAGGAVPVMKDMDWKANYDFGSDTGTGAGAVAGNWTGLALFLRKNMDPCAVAVRYEVYTDNTTGGAMGGGSTGNTLSSYTATLEHKEMGGMLSRLEVRHDVATAAVVGVKSQTTYSWGLVQTF